MIHDQAVEVAEEISPEFAEGGSDGLLGLACQYSFEWSHFFVGLIHAEFRG